MASHAPKASTIAAIARLAEPAKIGSLDPIAARFVYSLRLIALHERARRDPVPELAARLGSFDAAAKALDLAQTIKVTWPENIHVSRFCCTRISHDEKTIGTLVEAALARNQSAFHAEIAGLIRPERIARLWDAASGLVMAELGAHPLQT